MEAVGKVAPHADADLPLLSRACSRGLCKLAVGGSFAVWRTGLSASRRCFARRVSRPDRKSHRHGPCEPASIAIGKDAGPRLCERPAEERSEEARRPHRKSGRAGSAHAGVREPRGEPSLGGFVDRLSLLSDVDEEQGSRDAACG